MISVFCVGAVAKSDFDKTNVTDYSGVLSDFVKEYISAKNDILFEQTGAKIIFLVTDSVSDTDIKGYTENLYDLWGISDLGRKNSIFVVVDTGSKEYSFLKGKNLKYALTDSEVYKYFVDSFEPYFSENSYDRAVMSLYNALGRWYEANYNDLSLSLDDDYSKYMYGTRKKDVEPKTDTLWLWVGVLVCLGVLIISLCIKRNMVLKQRRYERRKLKEKRRIDIDKITNS